MSVKILWLTVIGLIWILGLIITGILALVWNNRFKGLKDNRIEYQKKLTIDKQNYKLSPIKLDYELPKNETAFLDIQVVAYFLKIKQINWQDAFFENNFKKSNRLFFGKTKLSSEPLRLIFTNKHLVLETQDNYLKAKISEIILSPITFYNGFEIINGSELIISEKRFLLANHETDLLITYQLLRGE